MKKTATAITLLAGIVLAPASFASNLYAGADVGQSDLRSYNSSFDKTNSLKVYVGADQPDTHVGFQVEYQKFGGFKMGVDLSGVFVTAKFGAPVGTAGEVNFAISAGSIQLKDVLTYKSLAYKGALGYAQHFGKVEAHAGLEYMAGTGNDLKDISVITPTVGLAYHF